MNQSDDILQAVEVLKTLEPGKLPLPIFLEVARLTVTPIIEIVPLRKNIEGRVEVLLTKREDDDAHWAGMYHTPGTVIRASDIPGSYDDAFKRIISGELGGISVSEPVYVTSILHKVKRGMESALIFWVEVNEEPKTGEFFDYGNLPEDLIDTQKPFIKMAIKDFLIL